MGTDDEKLASWPLLGIVLLGGSPVSALLPLLVVATLPFTAQAAIPQVTASKQSSKQVNTDPIEQSVEVHDWAIVVPPLPESVKDAHSRGSAILSRISRSQADLDRMLALASRDLPILPNAYAPKDAVVVKELAGMINDQKARALHEEVARAWFAMRKVFAEYGLTENPAQPPPHVQARKDPSHPAIPVDSDNISKRMKILDLDRIVRLRNQTRFGELLGVQVAPLSDDPDVEQINKHNTTQKIRAINEAMAPQLSVSWSPYAAHLEAQALKLLTIESNLTPESHPAEVALVRHAKAALLSQFKVALSDSRIVWELMTKN
jgi:hypothetical protein